MVAMEKASCWICGGEANSREHVFKSSDLKRIFDSDGREFENLPFHFGKERPSRIAGSKSDKMKYDPSLCSECNNSKTARCDRAYDRLSDWFAASQQSGGCQCLPLAEVFGQNYPEEIEFVRRYFSKSLGCRILAAEGDYRLGKDFPNPVTGANLDKLSISISRTQLWRLVPDYRPQLFEQTLGKGDLLANYSRSIFERTNRKEITQAVWQENIGHYQINHWLNIRPHPSYGEPLDCSTSTYEIVENEFDLVSNKQAMQYWIWGDSTPEE
jgi:hypothetical protein